MRLFLIAAALCLSACGSAGGNTTPADTFVLGVPQYKQPNVKQTTKAYKEAFTLAKSYKPDVPKPVDVKQVAMGHRQAVANAEAMLRAPKTAKEDSAAQKKYFKGIRKVQVEDCHWSRISVAAKENFLYGMQGAEMERGWLCLSKITLKLCSTCQNEDVLGVMLFAQRDTEWLFLGAREYDIEHGIGCSWKNFLGTNSMPGNGLGCIEPVNQVWPLTAS